MNHKRLDYYKSSKSEENKYINICQNKQDKAMVSVGMKKAMKSGYWSKKPGQKARYISLPARQPCRKGSIRSKTSKHPHHIKHYNPDNHSWNKKKSMNRRNVINLKLVNNSIKTWERPMMPYKFHI